MTEAQARRLILFAIAAALVGWGLAWSLYLVREALTLVYLSLMLALGISPAVSWLERQPWIGRKRRTPRWAAVLVFYLAAASVLVAIYLIVVPPFIAQVGELWTRAPEYVEKSQTWLVKHQLQRRVFSLRELLDRAPNPNAAASAVTGVLGVVNRIAGFFLAGFTVVLLSVYFLLDGEGLFKMYVRALPKEARGHWWKISSDVAAKVGAWMGGQAFLCVLIGSTAALGFWLIGLPYFYVLALICGVGELVPIVGPITAAIPAIIVASTVSANTAIITAVYLFVQQQVENNVIIPRLMKSQTGVSPLIVMVAILVGGEFLGVIGALLAVPTAAVIQIFLRDYLESRDQA
jgi:predicted PurR-regulated permease PerM